jgi:futalosine hydrolase
MRLLVVTAVDAETRAIGSLPDVTVVTGGIGRTNAAAATTASLVRDGAFDAVLSAGVAGALPDGGLGLGDAVLASACVYAEEGIATAHGHVDLESIGLELGDFEGNVVPVDETLLERLEGGFRLGPIATVATCSGTDAAAREIARRTGAVAEAMEGAAVVHAARRLRVPAIELRAISNTTGDRAAQNWDLEGGLRALGTATREAVGLLRSSGS